MANFFAKLLPSLSAVAAFKEHIENARARGQKLSAFIGEVDRLNEASVAAENEFRARPSKATFEKWIALESRREATFRVQQKISTLAAAAEAEAIAQGGKELGLAACLEVETTLKAQLAEVEKRDGDQTEEFGTEVTSTAVIRLLRRKLDDVDRARTAARGSLGQTPRDAWSILAGIIGPTDAQFPRG